jgi:UDP-glucose 4-epimerase
VRTHYGGERIALRPVEREDASAVDSGKARRLLGWSPTRSWRDYLDQDGHARP